MSIIDLRSDTVTKAPKEMLDALVNADVGDAVLGDDPTVFKLQELACEISGKPASLYVTSGTMANQLAVNVLTSPGDEIILDVNSHIFKYESGAVGFNSLVNSRVIKSDSGLMDITEINDAIRPFHSHYPKTSLICLENTHNLEGGKIISIDYIKTIYELAKKNNINVHLDGARIFNASVETNIPVKEYAKYTDTIMFCLSKGLCCPVGSILCGSKEAIEKATKTRTRWGGGMRQAGYLAACGIYALNNLIHRLKEDHENAKYLAKEMANIDYIDIQPEKVETNMIFFSLKKSYKAENLLDYLKENGIIALPRENNSIRFVLHKYITRDMVKKSIEVLSRFGK